MPDAAERDAEWQALMPLLNEFWLRVQQGVTARHAPGRLKLWLNSLRRCYRQADDLYHRIRGIKESLDVSAVLSASSVMTG